MKIIITILLFPIIFFSYSYADQLDTNNEDKKVKNTRLMSSMKWINHWNNLVTQPQKIKARITKVCRNTLARVLTDGSLTATTNQKKAVAELVLYIKETCDSLVNDSFSRASTYNSHEKSFKYFWFNYEDLFLNRQDDIYNKALQIRERITGKDDYYYLLTLENITNFYFGQRYYEKSLNYYRECISIANSLYPNNVKLQSKMKKTLNTIQKNMKASNKVN